MGNLDYKERIMNPDPAPVVFTPSNEPYLGRNLLFHFDQIICSIMEQNTLTAPLSYEKQLKDQQKMACQVIPQAISITLSIRELIRQGYLFSGHVLLRPLVERAVILLYLHLYPEEIEIWKRGWHMKEAPSLSKMFDSIQKKWGSPTGISGIEMTASMNSLLHAKPNSAWWNLERLTK